MTSAFSPPHALDLKERKGSMKELSVPEEMTTEVDLSSMTANRESSELPNDMSEWSADEVAAYTALRSKRKKCCVGGCTHRSLPIARSYHQLPVRNREIWEKWIEVVRWSRNEPDWSPNGDAAPLVCSRHFPDSDFISYEASSRVRLSHTAIPQFFVEPPEGTVMDARFSNPFPIPPMLQGAREKVSPKSKNNSMNNQLLGYPEEGTINGRKIKYESTNAGNYVLAKYADEMAYDIEEISEETHHYDEREDDERMSDNVGAQFPYLSMNPIVPGVGYNKSATTTQPTSSKLPRRNLKYANSISKPPALIRANFAPFKDNHHSNSVKPVNGAVGGSIKTRLPLPLHNPSSLLKQRTPSAPTKHKIGLAKCRLIVQTLENQLKIAKMRLAEQLEIPYQVVHGVWNMRDSLKDKL